MNNGASELLNASDYLKARSAENFRNLRKRKHLCNITSGKILCKHCLAIPISGKTSSSKKTFCKNVYQEQMAENTC